VIFPAGTSHRHKKGKKGGRASFRAETAPLFPGLTAEEIAALVPTGGKERGEKKKKKKGAAAGPAALLLSIMSPPERH